MSRLRNFARASRLYYSQALSVELVYRFSLFQSFFGVAVGFVGLIFFWLAAGSTAGAAALYPKGLLVAYFVFTSAHSILHENRLSWNLSSGIRLGKLSASMLRPYPYLVSLLAQASAHATMRLVIMVPIFALLFGTVGIFHEAAAAVTWQTVGFYCAAMLLGFATGWLIKIAVGLLAFDMTQTWGPELIFMAIFSVASGVSYPLDLLPQAVLTAASWTPVYYMIGFPTLVLLGRIHGDALWLGLGQGLLVTAVTAALVLVMWRRGMGKFEAVGI